MPHHTEVKSPSSLHPNDEKVSKDQGGTRILIGQTEVEMHNISFEKYHQRVVQSNRVPTLKDQEFPMQVEEEVIVTDVHQHPTALADATRVYAKATSSSVCFFIPENE